jgi:predicted  nucleic acid-binding Zn-ribbon protein
LIALQDVDTKILFLHARIDEMPSRLAMTEAPLKKLDETITKAQKEHDTLLKKRKDKERDADVIREKINKAKLRSSEIKTNKEYQAHLREIEAMEGEIHVVEDEVLLLMESLEESSKRVEEDKAAAARELIQVERLREECRKTIADLETELGTFREERKKIAGTVLNDVYTTYINLLKTRRGLAVVEAKNEICGGCNLHIPPQLFVEIKTTDEIIQCPQCRRILYFLKQEQPDPLSQNVSQ